MDQGLRETRDWIWHREEGGRVFMNVLLGGFGGGFLNAEQAYHVRLDGCCCCCCNAHYVPTLMFCS
ncbi:hypothetical protein BDR22DRAFT_834728 [Usnea florida]